MFEGVIAYLVSYFSSNIVNIPLIEPIVDFLLKIPIINLIVSIILWRPAFAILIIPGLLAIVIVLLFIIWFERKITARVQWRVGPKEVSRHTGGVIQAMADMIRYLFQEIIIHRDSHAVYFIQFPILSFIPILLPILLIPAGPIYAIKSDYAIPIIVALSALIPLFIMGIGWSANNRYAYIGAIREAFMYFAYEIPFIIAVLSMVLLYGSGNPFVVVEKQTLPGFLLNPIAFIVYLIGILMATSRLPFEIPEADQEIAFGPFVEYSGIIFGLVMGIAYEKMYILSLLATILFFKGWEGPIIPILGDLNYAIWLFVKSVVLMCILVLVRSIYARYRLDQALKLGWSSILAFSLFGLFLSMGWYLWQNL